MRLGLFICLLTLMAVTPAQCYEWVEVSKGTYYDKTSVDKMGDKVSAIIKTETSDILQLSRGQKIAYFQYSLVFDCRAMAYKEIGAGAIDMNGNVISTMPGKNRETEILGSPHVDVGRKLCVPENGKSPSSGGKKKK